MQGLAEGNYREERSVDDMQIATNCITSWYYNLHVIGSTFDTVRKDRNKAVL